MTDAHEEQPREITINDLVDELVVALMNTRMYWADHPRVQASIEQLQVILPALMSQHEDESLDIYVTEDRVVYRRRQLIGASVSAPRLISAIHERKCGGIRFESIASPAEYQALFSLLVDRTDTNPTTRALNARLVSDKCTSIQLLDPPEKTESGGTGRVSMGVYQEMVRVLQDAAVSVCNGGTVQFDESQACIEKVLQVLDTENPAAMLSAVRYEQYDAFTFGHSVRVAALALNFARTLTTDDELLNRIGVAALLHDVGKIKVPFEILHCHTPLDEEQRRLMETHPEVGAEILMDHDNCDPMCYGAAFGHHLDGAQKGYPRLLHDPDVSLVTNIVRICDVYEAFTAVRPFRTSMSSARAFKIMIDMGQALDRVMLKHFIQATGVFPAGARVLLSTNEQAAVLRQTQDLFHPIIQIDTDPHGHSLSPTHHQDSAAFTIQRVLQTQDEHALSLISR